MRIWHLIIKQFKVLHKAFLINRRIFRLWPTMFGKLQNCVINLTTKSGVNHLDLASGHLEHGSFQSLAAELDLRSSDSIFNVRLPTRCARNSFQLLKTFLKIAQAGDS